MKAKKSILFCDISKAFDWVWHEGLIYKLQTDEITGSLIMWFPLYLAENEVTIPTAAGRITFRRHGRRGNNFLLTRQTL